MKNIEKIYVRNTEIMLIIRNNLKEKYEKEYNFKEEKLFYYVDKKGTWINGNKDM